MALSRTSLIGPSILSADFLQYGEQLNELEAAGADYVHFDVMDGAFVPNISIGIPILEATRRGTDLPIDVHLMLEHPDRWIDPFCRAGANSVTFHAEATPHIHRVVQNIREAGVRPGVAINPATPIDAVREILPYVDHVLVMTVNPGFGGQTFIGSMVGKIGRLRELIDAAGSATMIQVDGGINPETIRRAWDAGARSFVAGSSVFEKGDIAGSLAALRSAIV